MNYSLIILFTFFIIIFAFITKNKLNKKINKKMKGSNDSENFKDLNDIFINNSENRQIIDIIRIYNPIDGTILRSILDSHNIETYVKFNNMNNLYPGIQIPGHTTSIISIFADKLDETIPVFDEYIESLKKIEPTKIKSKIRNVIEFSIASQTMPSGRDKRFPELLK